MNHDAEKKLNDLLLRVTGYIEKHEDLREYTAQTEGKKLYSEILWWLNEINKERA